MTTKLNPIIHQLNKEFITGFEGLFLNQYTCPTGHLTIGIGHKQSAEEMDITNITIEDALLMFDFDYDNAVEQAITTDEWKYLDEVRQCVIIGMIFQMGLSRYKKFKRMRSAIRSENYARAADEMINSRWHRQSPKRCEKLSDVMEYGSLFSFEFREVQVSGTSREFAEQYNKERAERMNEMILKEAA